MKHQIAQIKKQLKNSTNGLLFLSAINNLWLLDFDCSAGYSLINYKGQVIFITDSRYFLAAKDKLSSNKNIKVWCIDEKNSLLNLLKKAKETLKISKIFIEEDYVTLSQYKFISKVFKQTVAFNSKILRSIKTDIELKKLQASANIIVKTMKWVKKTIKVGMSEIEIARMISMKILELGASGNSFSPIVAAGLNSANPHHKPSKYIIKEGDFVIIDIGCMYDGYASDMTRTFVVGKKTNNKELIDIYQTVLKSQLAGLKNAVANTTGKQLDNVCRSIIDKTKYKGLFGHGTGHGVGLEVHELPNVNQTNTYPLLNNSVVTIEPGIYKQGVGGVRIEDTIVIKGNKCIMLTKLTKELEYVKN